MKRHKERIDEEKIKNGLSELGPTANPTQFAFLKLNLSNQNLYSCFGIEKYIHIIHLDISHNQLVSLRPLSSLR